MASKHAGSRSPSPSLRLAEDSQGSPQRPTKRAKGAPGLLASRRIFILQAKLSQADISEVFDLAENAEADIVSSPDEADIVITAIGMRKRLERHLDWNLAVSVEPASGEKNAWYQYLTMTTHTETKGLGDAGLVTCFRSAGPPAAVRRLRRIARFERDERETLSTWHFPALRKATLKVQITISLFSGSTISSSFIVSESGRTRGRRSAAVPATPIRPSASRLARSHRSLLLLSGIASRMR